MAIKLSIEGKDSTNIPKGKRFIMKYTNKNDMVKSLSDQVKASIGHTVLGDKERISIWTTGTSQGESHIIFKPIGDKITCLILNGFISLSLKLIFLDADPRSILMGISCGASFGFLSIELNPCLVKVVRMFLRL